MAERIESILIDRLLQGKRWLDYVPAERGRRYRVFRALVVAHPVFSGILFSIGVGAVARWVMPLFVPGFWTAVSTGGMGHLVNFIAGVIVFIRGIHWIDERLYFDPHKFATSHFRRLAFPWQDAYESIAIRSRKDMDRFVITARHARDVADDVTYGILVAKVADVLAESSDAGTLKGLDTRTFIEMMMAQKLEDPKHQQLMEQMFQRRVRPEALARALEGPQPKGPLGGPEVRKMLEFWLKQGTYQLRVDLPQPLNHVGSQLSRGYLDLRGDVGQNCLSYMGRHSETNDFPMALIRGDAGDSLATSARRGLVYCSGDVGDDCGKGMTGGIIIVGGRPGNRFGYEMDDRTNPAVLVAYRGIDGYLPDDTINNGLIMLFNLDIDQPPSFLRFRDGQREAVEPTLRPDGIYQRVVEYVLEWRKEHDAPFPSELSRPSA